MNKLKCIIKPIAFIILFLILFSAVSIPLFVSSTNREYQWMSGIYAERDDSLDAVYIGSSSCYTFWNPTVAWEQYGIAVLPYVCSSQPLVVAEYLVREARKTQPDALYIINTNSISDGVEEIDDVLMHNLLDYMPLSVNKLRLTDYLCDTADLSFSERLEYYFPIIRYHDVWDSLTEENFDYSLNGLKGADIRDWYLGLIMNVTDEYLITDECLPVSEAIVESVDSLLDYCEQEDVNVLFVTVPRVETEEGAAERINTVNSFIESRGFEVLDLVDKLDEIGLDTATDYYNLHHTNLHGSIKYTYYLSEYLIEKYGFTDKRGEEDYADWDEAVVKYNEIIKARRLPAEYAYHNRNYSIPAPYISSLATVGNDSIYILWTLAYGAEGYEIYRKVDDVEWIKIGETAQADDTSFTDTDAAAPGKYVYTIVPFYDRDGERYYGKFNYWGYFVTK